jgi:putative SOS response-associated peptidase YedK
VSNYPPRWNAAPSQELLVIRRNHQTGQVSLDPLRWGLIPYWCKDSTGGRKPINVKAETVSTLPTFRDAYRLRRCILPVDGFYEWKAIKGQRAKQPYAIGMKDGSPFGIAGVWENWKDLASGEWIRTFAVITTDANKLVAEIHDRMPAILAPEGYTRWLSDEPDPRDLMRPLPPHISVMLKSPLPGSEELLRRVKAALGPDREPLLIAIDGRDGVGKSSLASWLAWQLGMPSVHLDLYLIRGSRPLKWMTAEIDRLIQARLNLGRPLIVEGMLVLDVLDQISRAPDFLAYVSGKGGNMFSKRLDQYQVRYDPVKRAHFSLNGFDEEIG